MIALDGLRFADEVAPDRGLMYKASFPRELDVIGACATEGESH